MPVNISRRQFVSGLGAMALGGGLLGTSKPARAANGLPFLYVNTVAYGGWDTTMLCDPKMSPNAASPVTLAYNDPSQLTAVGPFTLPDPSKGAVGSANVLTFFQKYTPKILALNGVDATTTQHDEGQLVTTSGITGATYPVLSGLVAAAFGAGMGAPFMSAVGVNTQGLIGITPLDASMSDALGTPLAGSGVHSTAAWTSVQAAINARLARRQSAAILTTPASRLRLYRAALDGAAKLDNLMSAANEIMSSVPSDGGMGDVGGGFAFDVAVTLASYLNGQTVSAQLGFGGFDTHTQNDAQQAAGLDTHFAAIDYLMRAAAHVNLQDQLMVHMGSDFGRCPFYNGYDNGKDHWPTTTVLLVGSMVGGGRLIGASDDGVMAKPVDPVTLQLSDTGTNITHGHIHNNLRRYMKIDQSAVAAQFGIKTEVDMNFIT